MKKEWSVSKITLNFSLSLRRAARRPPVWAERRSNPLKFRPFEDCLAVARNNNCCYIIWEPMHEGYGYEAG